jgi:hypothetical protein
VKPNYAFLTPVLILLLTSNLLNNNNNNTCKFSAKFSEAVQPALPTAKFGTEKSKTTYEKCKKWFSVPFPVSYENSDRSILALNLKQNNLLDFWYKLCKVLPVLSSFWA